MDFKVILNSFREYLELKSDSSSSSSRINYDNISIFEHKDEFKQFMLENYNYDMSNISGITSEIKKLQIVDGVLVNPDDLSEEEKNNHDSISVKEDEYIVQMNDYGLNSAQNVKETDNSEIVPEGSIEKYSQNNNVNIEGAEFITAVLNEFLKDETFRSAINKNGDDVIDETDIEAFLDVIKSYGDDEKNISLDDLLLAAEDIQEGTFRFLTDEQEAQAITQDVENQETFYANKFGLGMGNAVSRAKTAMSIGTPKEISIQNKDGSYNTAIMSISQLEQAETTESGKVESCKKALDEVIEDAEGQKLKETMLETQKSYTEMLNEFDSKLAQKINDEQQKIDAKENEIKETENEITNVNSSISEHESQKAQLEAQKSSFESAKSALTFQLSSAKTQEEKQSIQAKIEDIENQILEVENKIKEEEQAIEKLKEKLQELENKKTEQQTELTQLKEEMSTLEKQAQELEQDNPELKQLNEQYTEAKEKYEAHESEKQGNIQSAREALKNAQNNLQDIQKEIESRKTKTETYEQYDIPSSTQAVELAKTFEGKKETEVEEILKQMMGKNVNLPDGLWCAAFVRKMLENTNGNLPDWYNSCNTNSCSDVFGAARANGAAFTDVNGVQTGDLIFFNTNRGNCRHIGFVTEVKDGYIYTIEGNSSSKVSVRKYPVDSGKVFGFARVA